MSRSSIPILYIKRVPVYFVRAGFSWFKRGVSSGGFRYSFGIGFVDFVVQNLSGYWMDPISAINQIAPLKLVFIVRILKKIALPCGASSKF